LGLIILDLVIEKSQRILIFDANRKTNDAIMKTQRLFLFTGFLSLLSLTLFSQVQDGFYGPHFRHIVSQENREGIETFLDHPQLNGNPDAFFVASPNLEPNQVMVGDNFTFFYNTDSLKWSIRNADETNPFPIGCAFNVLVPTNGGGAILAISGGVGTTFGIDAPFTNDNEDALLFINTLHPGGSANSQFVVIYFPAPFNSWTISSLSDIPEGREFYVFVPEPSNHTFVHRVSNPNTSITFLNHPLLNGNPDADILFQRQFNFDNGSSTTWNQNKKSLRYINDLWFLSIDDGDTFFENEDYNIVILNAFPGERCSFPKQLVCGDILEYSTEGVLNDSDQSNPPDCEGFQEVGTGGQQWFSFTAEDDDYLLTLSTCESSDFFPSIAIYEGECGDFNCVDFDTTPCEVGSVFADLTFNAEQGNTYYMRVGGFGATEGDFTLNFDCQITTDVTSSIAETKPFEVYPNPSNGNVNLNWAKKEGFGYEIQSPAGQIVTSGTSRAERITIDLNSLTSGIYMVKVFDGKEVQTQRLVISGM
jgi:hypothetical protein